MKNKKGFSLTELIAVIVIIGVIILVMIPVSKQIKESKKVKEHEVYFKTLIASINNYLDTVKGFYALDNDNEYAFVPFDNWEDYKDNVPCLNSIDNYVENKNKDYACKMSLQKFLDLKYFSGTSSVEDLFKLNSSHIYIGISNDKSSFFLDSLKVTYNDNIDESLKIDGKKVVNYYYNYQKDIDANNNKRINYKNGFYGSFDPNNPLKSD